MNCYYDIKNKKDPLVWDVSSSLYHNIFFCSDMLICSFMEDIEKKINCIRFLGVVKG